MNRKILVVFSFVFVLSLLLCACQQQDNVADTRSEVRPEETGQLYSGQEGQIIVYVSGPQEMADDIEDKFEEERGDVLNMIRMRCEPLRQLIWTEMKADNIQADVAWGGEPNVYITLKEKAKLLQYKSPQAGDLRTEYRLGDAYYTPANGRYAVIVYNKNQVSSSEAPSAWSDLVNEKWEGRLVMADATQAATSMAIVSGLMQFHSDNWEYLKALKKNKVMLTIKNKEAFAKVSSGVADVAIVPHDGALRNMQEARERNLQSPLKIVWPDEHAINIFRPVAIFKNDARPEVNDKLAKDFVDFLLSPTGQEICRKYKFISVRKDVELPEGVPQSVKAVDVDWEYATEHEEELHAAYNNIMLGK